MYKNASDGLSTLYTHVNHQEKKLIENKEEIQDLKQQIKALKEQQEHYQDYIEEALNICGFQEGDSIIDAVKTLKEENEKLKENVMDEYGD